MEEKKIVVYVLHGFWENEFTNGCTVVDVSIDLEAVMKNWMKSLRARHESM